MEKISILIFFVLLSLAPFPIGVHRRFFAREKVASGSWNLLEIIFSVEKFILNINHAIVRKRDFYRYLNILFLRREREKK